MTDRERFLYLLSNQPHATVDAIAVFSGEDSEPRVVRAAQLFGHRIAPTVVLYGGRDTPSHIWDERRCHRELLGLGVHEDRIVMEPGGPHTRAQALNLVASAQLNAWNRVALVVSAYHLPRAFLTVLKALANANVAEKVKVLPVSANQSPWWEPPLGMTETRAELLARELVKIDTYAGLGHCATPTEGLAYLRLWEGPS